MDEKLMSAMEDLMEASLEQLFLTLRGNLSKEEKVRAVLAFHFTNEEMVKSFLVDLEMVEEE
jgi:hypothetical protein